MKEVQYNVLERSTILKDAILPTMDISNLQSESNSLNSLLRKPLNGKTLCHGRWNMDTQIFNGVRKERYDGGSERGGIFRPKTWDFILVTL